MRIGEREYRALLARSGTPTQRRRDSVEIAGIVLEPGYVLLVLPLPPSKNREPSHRWARYRLKQEWEQFSYQAWLAAGMPRFDAVEITPRFCVWRLRDADNNNSLAFKGIIDGLKGRLVPDDSIQFLALAPDVCEVDRNAQRLELHIRANK